MTLILKTSMAVKTDWIYRFQMSLPKEVHPRGRSAKRAGGFSKNHRESYSRSRNKFRTGEKSRHNPKGSSVRERRRKRKKKWPMLLIFLLLAVTAYGSFLYLHRPTGIWTVAVFGVDSRDGNTKKALARCTDGLHTGQRNR